MAKALMCAPEILKQDLQGRVFIVTGGNSGIGFECVKQLARQNAEVILACRRVEDGERRVDEIRAEHAGANVHVRRLDLASLASVRTFAAELSAERDALHGLLNNAGVMNTPNTKTADGFEMQFGVNHLGHFLLTDLLLEMLKKGAPSRIVNVSSCFHDMAMGRKGDIHFDDLNFQQKKFDGWEAYAQSKLANLLHARSLAKRLEGTGVIAVSVHPGWVRTDLAKHTMPLFVQNFLLRPMLSLAGMIDPWAGAQTSLHALLASDVPDHNGEFYSQTGTYRDKSCNKGGWPMRSPNPVAHDDGVAQRLWEKSEELVSRA